MTDRPGPQEVRVLPPGSVTVRCRLDGPLVVELPPDAAELGVYLRVTDHLGNEHSVPTAKKTVAFCRCNGTKTRPFCDGSHKTNGFKADETVAPQSPP